MLKRHGSLLLYQLEVPGQLFLRCWKVHGWETVSFSLQGTGILSDATSCHVTMEGLQLYPGLQRETTFAIQKPLLYSPSFPEIASPEELQTLIEISEIQAIDTLTRALSAHQTDTDLNTLFQWHTSKASNRHTPAWHTPLIKTASTLSCCTIIWLLLRVYAWKTSTRDKNNQAKEAATQVDSVVEPRAQDDTVNTDAIVEEGESVVRFAKCLSTP
jgi:hypothetical protein